MAPDPPVRLPTPRPHWNETHVEIERLGQPMAPETPRNAHGRTGMLLSWAPARMRCPVTTCSRFKKAVSDRPPTPNHTNYRRPPATAVREGRYHEVGHGGPVSSSSRHPCSQ